MEMRDWVIEKLMKKQAKDFKLCLTHIPMEMGTNGETDEGGPMECPPEVGDKRKYYTINSDDDYVIKMDSSHPTFSQKRVQITTAKKMVSKHLVVVKRLKLDSESDGESESEGNEESDSKDDDDAGIELSDCSGAESVCDRRRQTSSADNAISHEMSDLNRVSFSIESRVPPSESSY